ncbi:MAG: hypothetical protein JWO09_449 [Bacteroidetes bacterium]|nr:hypothetical protein [Bacteroidota bacterium]
MKKSLLFLSLITSAFASDAQTTLIGAANNGNFENATPGTNWTIVNPGTNSLWFCGTTSKCAGTNGAYIGTAVGNNNYNTGTNRIAHIYRDVTFPAGETQITLTFDWKGQGESTYDGLKVFIGSASATPVANTAFTTTDATASQIGSTWYNLQAACGSASITITAAQAGNSAAASTRRIVFSWQNDNLSGTTPAATFDNVVLTSAIPPAPNCATYTSPANGATGICNTSASLNWTAPATGGTPTGYLLYFGTDAAATNIVNGTNIGNVLTYNPGALTASTTYYWKIVPTNGGGSASGCTIYSFTTNAGCYPQATASYTACGGTYYDSNISGNYASSENSTITFCPSVAGQKVSVLFSAFNTEATYDILTVYNGPSTASPVLASLSGTTVPSCAYTSTDAGGCLTFRFVSDGSFNYSGWTAAISCVASAPVPNCSAITSPSAGATGICSTSASLNWSAPTGCGIPTGYLLYFGTDAAATNIVNGTNIGNVLTYNPGALSSSTTYYWKIVPTSSAGSASGCAINSFTTSAGCFTQQTGSFSSCSGSYYDSSPTGNYGNSENSTITFCPSTAGQKVQVLFNTFNTESGFDILTVYDGPTTASPVLATLSGSSVPSCPYISTNAGGCLTFRFVSDGSATYSGWDASISCVASAPLPGCATLTAPVDGLTGVCNTSMSLNWTAPSGCGVVTGYLLYFGTDPAATNIINGTNIGNVLTYNPGILSASTTYYWRAVPVNSVGSATGCPIYSFTTSAGCYTQQTGTFSACGGNYYDSNPTGNYANNENSTITFCPSVAGQFVQVNFSSFVTESGLDILTVYNGPTTASPVLGTLSGNIIPCTYTSTDAGGCLTFRFVSDGSTRYAGWNALISCVSTPPGPLAGSTCANALSITLPYSATSQTTACYGNDYTNASTGSCATLYESGEDHVYAYTASGAECIGITLSNTSTNSIGYQVYSGCPGSAGASCIGSAGGATSSTLTGNVTLPAAGTYYLVVDTWSTPLNANYDLSVSSFGSGPANDLPCSATPMTLGVTETGDNTCSGSSGEPAAPACWTVGNNNSVWYSIVPAGTTLKIRTSLGTLSNTQIAVYSGTCGPTLTMVASACNDNGPNCGSTTDYASTLSLTGLTAGSTYYIRVDGYTNLTGTFGIVAIDGASSFPPVAGQDCSLGNPVCNSTMSVSNPGYQGIGSTCDIPSSYCLLSAERGSAWYTWTTNAAGNINFDIVPNDWPGSPSTTSTDYDFALWKVSGGVSCATILAGTSTPVACNYSGLGVTGLSPTGNSPAAYPGFNASYEPQVACASGDTWILLINNHSTSTQGFTINFATGAGGAPINYTPSPTSITWSGGTNTAWNLASNWGGCAVPVCGIDAVVNPFTTQPNITAAMGAQYVKNLTINLGATLTLGAGSILHICGNLLNNGTIIASPTSTIIFDNAASAQTMTGNFTGTSTLGNLTVTKTGSSLFTSDDVSMSGSFTTSNSTSTFDSNGKYIKVAGNFVNAAGNTTFSNTGTTGTLEFNGTSAQTFTQGSSQLDLNNVLMNHTSTGVTLLTDMNIKASTGTLTLTLGKITTGAFKVVVSNASTTCVTAGNTSSYVNGFLRRYINNSTGSFDFPVGTSSAYQRANVNFTTAPTITYLTADFQVYGTVPGPLGSSECGSTYNMNALDNGFWNIDANTPNNNTGVYNMTLYNRSYTNAASGWTVMARHNGSATWDIVNGDGSMGTCVAGAVTAVVRNNMKGFSRFGTAQSDNPLPIELISFTGKNEGAKNKLEWTTASEVNNDYFSLEHSADGSSFETFVTKEGAGNSSVRINYDAYDYSPYNGTTYYRLKQTDYNGKYSYSSIISIENKLDMVAVSNVHPNPTTDDLNFDFYSPVKGTVRIMIMDYTGRIVADKVQTVEEGKSSLNTQMGELAKGVYALKVEFSEGGFKSITKVVKY